jgi:hypothetical protein
VLDRHKSDGKRYIVARENTPLSHGTQPLSKREKGPLPWRRLGDRTN